MIYRLTPTDVFDAYNPSAVDISYMVTFFRKFYTGRYRVYRVLSPELVSGIIGLMSCYGHDATTWDPSATETGETDTETVREVHCLKVYAIQDLKKGTVRFYVNYRVGTTTVSILGNSPSMSANYPVCVYIDNVTSLDQIKQSFNKGAYLCISHNTPSLDYVLDYYCKGVFTLDMFRESIAGEMDRVVEVKYFFPHKQYLTIDIMDYIP